MPIFDTGGTNPDLPGRRQIFSGPKRPALLRPDSCVTLEVFQELGREYNQSRRLTISPCHTSPLFGIMQRGFKVDETARHHPLCGNCEKDLFISQYPPKRYAGAVWDKPLNPRSPLQLQQFLYQTMKLPRSGCRKGVKRISTKPGGPREWTSTFMPTFCQHHSANS